MMHGTRLGVLMAALALFGADVPRLTGPRTSLRSKRWRSIPDSIRSRRVCASRASGSTVSRSAWRTWTRASPRRTTWCVRPSRGRTLTGVVHVPFGFDRADLEPGAEAALASIVKELREHPTMTIDLEGTTDTVGRLDYNRRLSERRVEAVTRWLTTKGVHRTRIVGAKGRGPVISTSLKDDAKRRVMVKLMTSAE